MPGLSFSNPDRVADESGDVILAGIGRIDVDSLARQAMLLVSAADDARRDGYQDDADDYVGISRLCWHLLYRAYRAQGMDDAAATAERDKALGVVPGGEPTVPGDYVSKPGDTFAGDPLAPGTLVGWDETAQTHYPAGPASAQFFIIEHPTRGVLLAEPSPRTGRPSFSPTRGRADPEVARWTDLRRALADRQDLDVPRAYVVRSPAERGQRWQRLDRLTMTWGDC